MCVIRAAIRFWMENEIEWKWRAFVDVFVCAIEPKMELEFSLG